MKKIVLALLTLVLVLSLASCSKNNTIIVYTEAGFAPFEYVKDGQITGVDVDIMEMVGEKLGKKVKFEDVNFNVIIDAVSEGKLTKCGAAGISITDERKEKVDFSQVYYQAYLYVIYNKNDFKGMSEMSDRQTGVYWNELNTLKNNNVGVQGGTTADLFLSDEIAEGGSIAGTLKTDFESLSVAVNAIGKTIDFVVIDELPAKQLVKGNDDLACLPLYYKGEQEDEIAYDEYAICVTKGETELLNAINEVLTELLNTKEGEINSVQKLVNKHLGITD